MKLLVVTQTIDSDDLVLGFMHGWIKAFAPRYEKISVICLYKGKHALPENVSVYSLGKELKVSKFQYLINFYRLIWQFRDEYETVFVHMNQEYILLAGFLWTLWGKKIYLWRNHHSGSLFTDLAALFCKKVFCTSKYSYTAHYKKTELMPVGVDTDLFKPNQSIVARSKTILFHGRIAPVKRPDLLIEILGILIKKGVQFSADIYGDALLQDKAYYDRLKQKAVILGLSNYVFFHNGVQNEAIVSEYLKHTVYVNLSSSGMYDKTIFQAMACGTLLLTTNKNLEGLIDDRCVCVEADTAKLADKLEVILRLSLPENAREYMQISQSLRQTAKTNSLDVLSLRLYQAMV